MAKTVTQVREEKRKLQESFAPTQEKLEAIHAQQMQDIGYDPNIARITYETIRAKVKQADEQAKKRANTIDVLTKKESRLDDVKAKRPAQSEAEKAADDAERNLKNYENSPAVKQRESSKTQLTGPHPQAQGNSAPQKDETLIRLQQEAEMARRNYESAQAAENDRNIYNQDMADINAMSDEQLENLANYAAVREQGTTGNPITDLIYLPAQKRKAAGDLLNTYGEKRLNELAETYSRSNAEREKEQVQEAAKEASTGAVGGTLTTIGGIAASPVSGWMGIKGRLDELGNATGRYASLQSFVPGDTMNVYTDTAKQNVTQQIEGDGSNVLRKGAALLYQAGVGAAESATKAIVLGPQVAAATSAMNAYSRALADASEKGATAEQAVLLATSNAALDYVMDKIPMDKLFSLAQSGSTNALKAAFKQAGIEMTTEGASFLGSQLLEIGTLQQSSEYAQSVQNYVDLGFSPEDAQHQAAKGLALQAGQQILVAGISGGVSAGVSTAIGNHRQKAADALLQEESAAVQQEHTPQEQPAQQPVEPQQAETAAAQEAARAEVPQDPALRGNTAAPVADTEDAERAAEVRAAQQERDIQQKAEEIDYQDKKARAKERKTLERQIAKTQADVDSGKGSPARLRQLKEKLSQMDMEESDYPRTRQEAIQQQIAAVDALSAEQHDAYLKRETGEATNRPNKAATNRLKAAKQELDRLRNMSDADYAAELDSIGLRGTQRAPWLDTASASLAAQERRSSPDEQTRSTQEIIDQIQRASGRAGQPERTESVQSIGEASSFLRDRLNQQQADYQEKVDAVQQGNSQVEEPARPIDTVSRMAEDIGRGATQRQQEAKNNMQSVTDQVAAMTGGGAEPNPQSQPVDDTAGTPPRNFTGKEQYENLLTDDNVKPGRASDVRQDEVPEYDQNGRRVSDVSKNLMGSRNTTDEAAGQIEDLIQSGVFSYDKKTNRQSLEEAYADISARGGAAVREEISRHLKDGTIQDGDVAKAATLVNQYIQSGDQDAANDMMADLSLLAQKSGRNLQLFSLIRKMTPEGQLSAIQATADRFLNSNGKTKGKGISADIPADLKNEYLEAARSGDKKRISDATNAIAQKVGAQCPATFAEKWDTWRYMCMLGNASTNIRNVAGNFFMKPYAAAKDELAAIMEAGMQKAGLIDKDQRTKAVKTDKELLQWAKADTKTEDAQNALRYSAKVGADVSQDIMQENRRIFEHDSMEKIRKATEWAPSEGDMIFKNGYYAKYLANFLTARGVTRADIEAGKVDADIMSQARQYAVDNAYINTFNDSNKFSDAISSVGKLKSSDNWVSRAFGRVVDGIIPFRRTPANILVRFKEYSPVEFVSAAAKLAMAKKGHGEYTAADFCNSIASGLTGTAAMVIGAAVANGIFDKKGNGVRLVGKATDEEKLQGKQDYSIEVTYNGKTTSYTIDWAAPANLPLFVGANVYSAMQKSYDNGDDALGVILNLADAGKDVLEPMLSLSCLSSLDDLVQSVKYAEDGSAVFKLVAAPATSYLTQAIPSLLRQTASVSNENKQTTFANDERKPVRDIQRTVSNIPFAGNELGLKTDKIDVWGQKQSTGSIGKRVFDSYLNPSKISAVTSDAATDEISRLAKTEYGEGVVPEVAPKTLTYTDTSGETHKDVRLTKEQWEKYATVKGQTSKKILNRLVASTDYAKMTDAGKAAVVKLVYEYADKTGAIDAIADHDGYPETWMEKAKRSGNPGAYLVSKVNNQQMRSAMDQLTSAWAHGSDRKAARVSLESTYESYQKSSDSVKTAVMDAAEGVTKKYLEARTQGFSSDAALSVIKQVQSIPEDHRDTRGYQLEAVARTPGLRESDMDKAMKLYLPEYNPDDKKPDVSRLRYDYIRKELGYSPKDYAAFQKAHSIADSEYGNDNGGTSKDEIRAAFEAYGYDQETADKIYTVLWGANSRAGKAVKSKILEIYG